MTTEKKRTVTRWCSGVVGWVVMVSVAETLLVALAVVLTAVIALQAGREAGEGARIETGEAQALALPVMEDLGDKVRPVEVGEVKADEGKGIGGP